MGIGDGNWDGNAICDGVGRERIINIYRVRLGVGLCMTNDE